MQAPCAAEQAAAPAGAPSPSVNTPVAVSRPSVLHLPATSPAEAQQETNAALHAVWHAAQDAGPAETAVTNMTGMKSFMGVVFAKLGWSRVVGDVAGVRRADVYK